MTKILTFAGKSHDVMWKTVFSEWEHEWILWAAVHALAAALGISLT